MRSAKIFLSFIACLLVLSVYLTYGVDKGKEIIENEFSACIVEICIKDSTIGEKCEILPPAVANVQVTVDANSYTRITLSQTGLDCK